MPIRQLKAAVTVSGTTATQPLAKGDGVCCGCRVVHTGSGATITITDPNGYDVLDGLGTVGASGLSLNADDIGGNPAKGDLTVNLTSGADEDTMTVYLYVKE